MNGWISGQGPELNIVDQEMDTDEGMNNNRYTDNENGFDDNESNKSHVYETPVLNHSKRFLKEHFGIVRKKGLGDKIEKTLNNKTPK